MKNLQIVIAQALHLYELEHIEQSISHEINNTIVEIVVNDESFEKIDCYLYWLCCTNLSLKAYSLI